MGAHRTKWRTSSAVTQLRLCRLSRHHRLNVNHGCNLHTSDEGQLLSCIHFMQACGHLRGRPLYVFFSLDSMNTSHWNMINVNKVAKSMRPWYSITVVGLIDWYKFKFPQTQLKIYASTWSWCHLPLIHPLAFVLFSQLYLPVLSSENIRKRRKTRYNLPLSNQSALKRMANKKAHGHWFGCRGTEPGFDGDTGAIKVW